MFKRKFILSLIVLMNFVVDTAYANEPTQETYNGITPEPVVLPADVEDGVMSNPDAPQESEGIPGIDQLYFECDTGQKWTTIDGETKMLDGNGEPVGSGENYLVIDVSQYQGDIDWQAVENSGVDGVIIRATSYAGGDLHQDDKFAQNIKGAMSVGLPVGVYVYSYAENASEALYEANVLLDILNDNDISPSDLELGVFYDLEGNDYTDWMGPEEYEPVASTFINRVEDAGYNASLYSYASYLNSSLDSPYLHAQTMWVAQYGPELTFKNEYQQPGLVGWQYQSDGNVPGISGNVDVNCFWITPWMDITSYQIEGNRMAVLADESLYVTENRESSPWVEVASDVSDFQLEGNRIAVLKKDGTLWVQEGQLNSKWVKSCSDVVDYQLEGKRTAVLKEDGTFWIQEGAINSKWVKSVVGVKDFQLEGNRIGVLKTDGTFWIQEGAINSKWFKSVSGVENFQLEGKRVGVLKTDGTFWVQEGALNSKWFKSVSGVEDFQLEGNRIGVLKTDGSLWVQEGAFNSKWYESCSDVKDFQLEGDRVGALKTDGSLWVQEGAFNSSWTKSGTKVQSFCLEGDQIVILKDDGTLWVQEGALNSKWVRETGA